MISIASQSPAHAGEILNAAFRSSTVNIAPLVDIIESDKATITIALPSDATKHKINMRLQAKGTGKMHHWAVFTMRNPKLVPQNIVVTIPDQGFNGSGVVWPQEDGGRIISVFTSNGVLPEYLNVRNMSAYAVTINPGFTTTIAIELSQRKISALQVWRRAAFDGNYWRTAFFHGSLLGITGLLVFAGLIMFIIRPTLAIPALEIFVFGASCWLLIEVGDLDVSLARIFHTGIIKTEMRATAEAIMVVGALAILITYLDLAQRSRALLILLLAALIIAIGLIFYAWIEPVYALGIIRLAFGAMVIGGLLLVFSMWQSGSTRAQILMPGWSVLTSWAACAALAVSGSPIKGLVGAGVQAGLVLVMLTLVLIAAQLSFGHTAMARYFRKDSGRRALALAGADLAVWDWQAGARYLHVGPELERALGLKGGILERISMEDWFNFLHPSDRVAAQSEIDQAAHHGGGAFTNEFRLRRGDGSYHWYQLRARALRNDVGSTRLIGTLADINEPRRTQDQILTNTVRDTVTGLPNRALFMDRLERALSRLASGTGKQVYIVVIDIDRFKSINDGLGHEAANTVLKISARRIAALAGSTDTVARLSGDRFAVIIAGFDHDFNIMNFAHEVCARLAAPFNVPPRRIFMTASLGICTSDMPGVKAETALKDAEIALYDAKRNGRDKIGVFEAGMRDERNDMVVLEQDLRLALERREIEVVFQPIMQLSDRTLAGFESLIRWNHPVRGQLSPDDFVSLAEETGIIRDLGRYVLNESGRQLGIWQRAFRPTEPLYVAVNVSSAQLLDGALIGELKTILAREDIDPALLKLELTESLIMENPALALKVLERVKDLGLGLACDDFGTGYSSLSNLRQLPFDTLKIDRSFIQPSMDEERAAIILDSIVMLAHDLDLTLVAEGIETEQQLRRIAEMGCDYGQGFHIGLPMNARQVVEALGGLPTIGPGPTGAIVGFWDRLKKQKKDTDHLRLDTPDLVMPRQEKSATEEGAIGDVTMSIGEELEPWHPPEMGIKQAVSTTETASMMTDTVPELASGSTLKSVSNQPANTLDGEIEEAKSAAVPVAKTWPEIGSSPLAPRKKTKKVKIKTCAKK